MPSATRIWQLISVALALALIATLIERHRSSTAYRPVIGTVPTAVSAAKLERLALSPSARRVYERYSL